MKLTERQTNLIEFIKESLSKTTNGSWFYNKPDSDCDDGCIMCKIKSQHKPIYIAQTSYDTLSYTTNHNVHEDGEFMAASKYFIKELINIIEENQQ